CAARSRAAAAARRPAPPGPRGGPAPAGLVLLGVAAALAAGAANALGAFLVDSAVARGLAPATAGLMLTLGSTVCVTARLVVGWAADRFERGHLGLVAALLGAGGAGVAL